MRAAPPVVVQCTGGPVWRAVQAALAALAGGVLVWWALALAASSFGSPAVSTVAATGAAALAAGAGWRAARQEAVQLNWDGQRWSADGMPGALDLMIDLGNWLLLRLRLGAPGSARWIAVNARDAGPALHALRTAVHAWPPGEVSAAATAERTAD